MDKELWFIRDGKNTPGSFVDKLKECIWRIVETFLFRLSLKFMSKWRVILLRIFGAKIGKGCYISNRAIFVRPWNLVMGNYCSIDDYAFIKCDIKVMMGDFVSIANYVKIIPSGHDIRKRNFEILPSSPLIIHNGVFVGADSMIGGSNTEIGEMAVIGARQYIDSSIPENKVVYDIPEPIIVNRLRKSEFEKYRFNIK